VASSISVAFAQGAAAPPPDPPQPPVSAPVEPEPDQPPLYPSQQPEARPGGYPPPQQGFAQPAGSPPQGSPPPPRSPFLKIAYLGVTVPVGQSSNYENPGLRFGTILGGRLSPQLSLNGELTLDLDNPKNQGGSDFTEIELDVAFSPLFHVPTGNLELVFGPKLGINIDSASGTFAGGKAESTATGWVTGINAGFFATLSGSTSIGGLVSFVSRKTTEVCSTVSGSSEQCTTSISGPSYKVLGFTGAILF
jgi:hypothetical protein